MQTAIQTELLRVHPVFLEEWKYSFDTLRDLTFEEFEEACDAGIVQYEAELNVMRQVDALTDTIPAELLTDALEWAESVEDMDWARHDRKWIVSHRDIAIATGRYREFTEADAAQWVYRGTGKATHPKPEFRHKGKSYILNDGFLDD